MEFQTPLQATLHYRITTPMFLGGEDQTPDQSVFRTASFKGALRFWWRALNWEAALNDCGGQRDAALEKLHRREGALFGSASDSEGGASQQSRVLLRCELKSCGILKKGDKNLARVSYLLGQGLWDFNAGLKRAALREGAQLEVDISMQPCTNAEQDKKDMEQVLRAAKALGCLGGLGSRVRRGFGSLSLQRLEFEGKEERFDSRKTVEQFIAELPRSAPWETAPLSAFTNGFASHIGAHKAGALEALTAVSNEMQMYRSYGRNGQVRINGQNKPAERNFKNDHDTAFSATCGQSIAAPPRRIVFGLPSGYHFSNGGDVIFNAKLNGNEIRRASPLFIHIHDIGNDGFAAVQTMIPAQFLPREAVIETSKTRRPQRVPFNGADYDVIRTYIKRFDMEQGQGARHA